MTVFVPCVMRCMKQPLKLDYLRAGLCILGAVCLVYCDALRPS